MANSFVTLKTIARQALPRLIDNLVFPNLVYRDFSEELHDVGEPALQYMKIDSNEIVLTRTGIYKL